MEMKSTGVDVDEVEHGSGKGSEILADPQSGNGLHIHSLEVRTLSPAFGLRFPTLARLEWHNSRTEHVYSDISTSQLL